MSFVTLYSAVAFRNMSENQHHLLATGPKTRHVCALSFPFELSGPVWAGKREANHEWEIDYIQMTSQKTASGHQTTERAKSVFRQKAEVCGQEGAGCQPGMY